VQKIAIPRPIRPLLG